MVKSPSRRSATPEVRQWQRATTGGGWNLRPATGPFSGTASSGAAWVKGAKASGARCGRRAPRAAAAAGLCSGALWRPVWTPRTREFLLCLLFLTCKRILPRSRPGHLGKSALCLPCRKRRAARRLGRKATTLRLHRATWTPRPRSSHPLKFTPPRRPRRRRPPWRPRCLAGRGSPSRPRTRRRGRSAGSSRRGAAGAAPRASP